MNRTAIACLLALLALLAGCAAPAPSASPDDDADALPIVDIREKLFIEQCNDVYLNPEYYADKAIRLEGIYDEFFDEGTGKTHRYVIRYGPGCCGNDGVAGFEILYDGQSPALNDWVRVVGVVEMVGGEYYEYVALRVSELSVLDERGEEFVAN